MPAAMPCNIRRGTYKETCRNPDAPKTKYSCIVEADESTRKRLEGTLHKDHQDHIAGKDENFLCLKHFKIPDAKAAVDKEWEKTRENTGMAADESQKQRGGDR